MIEQRWFEPTVEGRHSHRRALETQAVLAGWAAARAQDIPVADLSVAACDRIVLAAVKAVCERVLLWDTQTPDIEREKALTKAEDARYGAVVAQQETRRGRWAL